VKRGRCVIIAVFFSVAFETSFDVVAEEELLRMVLKLGINGTDSFDIGKVVDFDSRFRSGPA